MSTFNQNSNGYTAPAEETATVFKTVNGYDRFTPNDRRALIEYIIDRGQRIECMSNATIAEVDVAIPTIDLTYRRITPKTREHIVNWDENLLGVVLLNYRDGELYVIDGANRIAAAIDRSIPTVPAIIYMGLDERAEVQAFISGMRTKPVRALEEFRALLKIEDPAAMAIKAICEKYKITIGSAHGIGRYDTGTRVLANIRAAQSLVQQSGSECLDWVFKILSDVRWIDEPNGINAKNMMAFAEIYNLAKTTEQRDAYANLLFKILQYTTSQEFKRAAVKAHPNVETRAAIKILAVKIINGEADENKIKRLAHNLPLN